MEKIKTLEDFINEEIATVTGDVSKILLVSDLGKAILKNASDKYASQYKKQVDELESVVSDFAQWSRKYPRGGIYGISQMKMDDELISIEEKAKSLIPHEQQLTLTEKP